VPNSVPNSSLVDSEASALQRIGANNTSTDGAIFNARISLKPYIVNGDVNGLIDQLDVSTGGAQTGFYSGNLSAAMEQASGQGVSLLETTPGGQIANNWGFLNKTWDWSNGGETFWSGLSSKFASGAESDVFVYQTPDKAMSAGQLNWQGGYVWGNYFKNLKVPSLGIIFLVEFLYCIPFLLSIFTMEKWFIESTIFIFIYQLTLYVIYFSKITRMAKN
jgi:hypothetical protein